MRGLPLRVGRDDPDRPAPLPSPPHSWAGTVAHLLTRSQAGPLTLEVGLLSPAHLLSEPRPHGLFSMRPPGGARGRVSRSPGPSRKEGAAGNGQEQTAAQLSRLGHHRAHLPS